MIAEPAQDIAPHSVELEQALLGSIFVNNDAYYRVCDELKEEHFYEPIHRQIYGICGTLIRAGKKASPVSVKTFIPEQTDIAGLNPAQYLARLLVEATTVINAPDYANTIVDLYRRRELLRISELLARQACDVNAEVSTQSIIQSTEDELISLTPQSKADGFMTFSDALKQSVDMASCAYQREGGLSGYATGLIDLDDRMGGLQKSDLIIVAGRPGMGKTALATNIAYNIASDYTGQPLPNGVIEPVSGGIVGFFSLEMSAEQLATRVLSERVSIPSSRIRRGEIKEKEFSAIAEEAAKNDRVPLYIEQAGGLTINQVTSKARRMRRQGRLDVMIVDYLQLLFGSGNTNNRVQEMTEITTKLKALAKELNIPIIALSQLSRQVESREDKRPVLADLRDSGSIEQDADVVLFVYREEYYLKNREPKAGTDEWFKWQGLIDACRGKAEIIVSKQRHGPTGTVTVSFDDHLTRFGNLAREDRFQPRSMKEAAAERGIRVVDA